MCPSEGRTPGHSGDHSRALAALGCSSFEPLAFGSVGGLLHGLLRVTACGCRNRQSGGARVVHVPGRCPAGTGVLTVHTASSQRLL